MFGFAVYILWICGGYILGLRWYNLGLRGYILALRLGVAVLCLGSHLRFAVRCSDSRLMFTVPYPCARTRLSPGTLLYIINYTPAGAKCKEKS